MAYGDSSGFIIISLSIILIIFSCICWYKIFEKMGIEGWKIFIPVYNVYLMCEYLIGANKGWMCVLMFIPIVGAIFTLYLYFKLCQSFGYGLMFLIGFLVLNPIFIGVLGLGDCYYSDMTS